MKEYRPFDDIAAEIKAACARAVTDVAHDHAMNLSLNWSESKFEASRDNPNQYTRGTQRVIVTIAIEE